MKRPATLSATFAKTIRQPGRYGDGRGGHGLSLLVKPTKIKGRLSKTWAQRIRINGKIHQPGVGELPSSHPGRSPPPGPTSQTVHGRRPPTPNPENANVSPGDREGDPTAHGQMETRRQIRRKLACNPRRLCSSLPWRHTGRSNHHSRHHGLSHPHVAPKTRNRSPGQTTHLSSHEVVHRPGLSRRQPSRRPHHRCAGFQHTTTPAHEGPTPQPSRGCHQDRRSYRCPLGDHRRFQVPDSYGNKKW